MFARQSRRDALKTGAAAGLMLGLGDISFVSRLGSVSAAEAKLDQKAVQLRPEIEPLVRLIEDTPRDQLLEEVAARIRKGTT